MPAIGAFAAADVAILLMFGLAVMLWVYWNGIRPYLPGFVQTVLDPLVQQFGQLLNRAFSWLDSQIVGFVEGAWSVVWSVPARMWASAHAIAVLYNMGWRIVNRAIPAAISATEAYTNQQMQAAESYAYQQGQDAWHGAQGLFTTAEQDMARDLATAEAYAYQQGQDAWHGAQGLFTQAEAQASAEVAALGASISADLQQLESLLNIDISGLQDQLGRVFAQVEQDIRTGVSGAEAQAQAGIDSLDRALSGQIASVGAAAAAGIAAAEGEITDIRNMRCLKVCDPLGALGEALQLLDVGALLAFLGYAAANPQGAQDFLASSIAPGIEAVIGQAEALVGIGQGA